MDTNKAPQKLYTPPLSKQKYPQLISGSIIASFLIFASVPILHILNPPTNTVVPTTPNNQVTENPPEIITPPEPPKPIKKKIDDIELKLPPLDFIFPNARNNLKPGFGGTYTYYDPNQFNTDTEETIAHLLADLDKKPKVLIAISPLYPLAMKGVQGKVTLEFIILSNGRPTKIRVIHSTHREFEQAAIDSITKSKWQAGQIENQDVASIVRIPIVFNSN